ncbi:MAG: hypothetical protein AB7I18_06710 [Candidatus Berkiella sp.]
MPKGDIKSSSVTLYTWGTHYNAGNGMAHFLDASFFGGNVGHAAIELTIPANDTGKKLIQQYCLKGNSIIIPFERTTQNVLDENNKVKKQEVYKVYFSWWPGDPKGYDLRENINSDNLNERTGVDVGQVDPRFGITREQRTYRGPLGSRVANLANKEIAHLTALTPEQKAFIETQRLLNESSDKLEAITIIEKKLAEKDSIDIEGSLFNLLQQNLDNWQAAVKNPKTLDKKDIEKIKSELQDKKTELREERDILITKRDILKGTMDLETDEKIKNEILELKALGDDERRTLIDNKDERFSEQAYIQYQLQEVTKVLNPAQSVAVFCQMTPFDMLKDKILAVLFDKNYPPNLKDTVNLEQWRQFLPEEHKDVTKETMTKEIYEKVQHNAKAQKEYLFNRQSELFSEKKLVDKISPFMQGDNQSVVTRGHSPDDTVRLPVGGITGHERLQHGLNIERMLAKMRSLTEDGKKFNLATKNCSETTGAILAAGSEKNLKSYFKKKAWGGFGNPQEVLNGALQYQNAVTTNGGKKTVLERLSAWNPLNAVSWLGGKMLNKVADPQTSVPAKIALGIGLIPMAGLAAVTETVKAVFNPKKTFNNCTNFVKYAWNNNSTFLKICSVPAALIAGVAAIPAAIQHGVQKAIVEPLTKTTYDRAALLEKEKGIVQEPVIKRVKLTKDKLAEVEAEDPTTALATLQQLLQEHPDKIPVFTPKTQQMVNHYLKSLNRGDPEQAAKIETYENTVKEIYAKTNQATLPQQRFEQPNDQPRRDSLNAFARHREQQHEVPPMGPSTEPTKTHQPQRPD